MRSDGLGEGCKHTPPAVNVPTPGADLGTEDYGVTPSGINLNLLFLVVNVHQPFLCWGVSVTEARSWSKAAWRRLGCTHGQTKHDVCGSMTQTRHA